MKKTFYILIILVIVLIASVTTAEQKSLTQGQIDFILNLVENHYLKLKPELNKAYIDLDLWKSMDVDLKGDFTVALAIYCCNKKNTDLYWIEVYDIYSGKKLAKYSQSWGFKIVK